MVTIYKPTKKAIKKNAFKHDASENLRLIFRSDGSALLYDHSKGTVIQSDLSYRKPDSHVEQTDDVIPEFLNVNNYEKTHIKTYDLDMFGIKLNCI